MKALPISCLLILTLGVGYWILKAEDVEPETIQVQSSQFKVAREDEEANPLHREVESPNPVGKPSDGLQWFRRPDALAQFIETVRKNLYDDGGIDRQLEYIDRNSFSKVHESELEDLRKWCAGLADKGLVLLNPELFSNSRYGMDMSVRNYAFNELLNYNLWVRDREKTEFRWPEIETHPFNFVPEMLAAFLAGEKSGIQLSDSALQELGVLREQQLLQLLALEQEMQVLAPSVQWVFEQFQEREAGHGLGSHLEVDPLSLYPETASILEAQAELHASYLGSIRNILMSDGIHLADER